MHFNKSTLKITTIHLPLKKSSRLASSTAEVFLAATCETPQDDQLLLEKKSGIN